MCFAAAGARVYFTYIYLYIIIERSDFCVTLLRCFVSIEFFNDKKRKEKKSRKKWENIRENVANRKKTSKNNRIHLNDSSIACWKY